MLGTVVMRLAMSERSMVVLKRWEQASGDGEGVVVVVEVVVVVWEGVSLGMGKGVKGEGETCLGDGDEISSSRCGQLSRHAGLRLNNDHGTGLGGGCGRLSEGCRVKGDGGGLRVEAAARAAEAGGRVAEQVLLGQVDAVGRRRDGRAREERQGLPPLEGGDSDAADGNCLGDGGFGGGG